MYCFGSTRGRGKWGRKLGWKNLVVWGRCWPLAAVYDAWIYPNSITASRRIAAIHLA